jgi:hypothetical protein
MNLYLTNQHDQCTILKLLTGLSVSGIMTSLLFASHKPTTSALVGFLRGAPGGRYGSPLKSGALRGEPFVWRGA